MNLDPVCVHGIHVAQTQCKACLNERVIELETKLETVTKERDVWKDEAANWKSEALADTKYRAELRKEVTELQTKLHAWEQAAQEGHPSPCALGPLCPYCEIDSLRYRLDRYENLLRECLSDYGNPYFTDRYGMADRLRAVLTRDVENQLPDDDWDNQMRRDVKEGKLDRLKDEALREVSGQPNEPDIHYASDSEKHAPTGASGEPYPYCDYCEDWHPEGQHTRLKHKQNRGVKKDRGSKEPASDRQ